MEENKRDSEAIELACTLDDMTAESIAFAMEELMANGAMDVYAQSIMMKKGRPGTLLTVNCREEDREKILGLIFQHTTTIGVKEYVTKRYGLERSMETVSSSFGPVRKKISEGYGVKREKLEYEDLSRIARENGFSLEEIRKIVTDEEAF